MWLVIMAMNGPRWKLIEYHVSTVYSDAKNESCNHTTLNQLVPDIHGPVKTIVANSTCYFSSMTGDQFFL